MSFFDSLTFNEHPCTSDGVHATHTFDNGWKVSLVAMKKSEEFPILKGCVVDDLYEVAVIRPNGELLDDVLDWQTKDQIHSIAQVVSLL